jgi:hypothetical protein
VKRVKGSRQGDYLRQLSFGRKDGTQIAEIKLESANQYGPETVLDDDEEIIGVFGTRNLENYISQLGFLIWKPPRL